jgi:hypothetical protein
MLALLLLPHAASASDPEVREKPRRATEIIAPVEDRLAEPSWTSHIHIKKKHGLEFKRTLNVGDRPVILSVHGPLIRHKRLGLGFEFKF